MKVWRTGVCGGGGGGREYDGWRREISLVKGHPPTPLTNVVYCMLVLPLQARLPRRLIIYDRHYKSTHNSGPLRLPSLPGRPWLLPCPWTSGRPSLRLRQGDRGQEGGTASLRGVPPFVLFLFFSISFCKKARRLPNVHARTSGVLASCWARAARAWMQPTHMAAINPRRSTLRSS